jgi:NAD(P)-dependent dehydrogenase (short-subunit alcohol dehydrogenase family)
MAQVAVVTGASAGVGRATARAFAERGFDVALLARGQAGLDAAVREVHAAGQRALAIPTDVAEFEQVDRAASRVEAELGPIDVWVNDAMTTVFAPSWEVKPADFQRAIEVTFLGQVWGTMAALSRMRPRDRGSIVNVGSALAFIGIPLQAAYCSSKFACRGFFESARAELIHEGSHVRMSMVHLPAVNTPQFDWCQTAMSHYPMPVPPIYQPEIPAKFIVDAALDGRRDKIVGSWNKMLVVVARLMPGLGNQYAAIGAWGAQLTSQEVAPNRPVNLYEPADAETDHGAHGSFDAKAGGFLDPSFLKSIPNTVKTFCQAVAHTAKYKKLTWENRKRHGLNPTGMGPAERPLYTLRAKSATTQTPAPTR